MSQPAESSILSSSNPALFLGACGATGSVSLELELEGKGGAFERRTFHQPSILIGRNPDADLVLDHEDVSRRHVYLQVIAGRIYGLDLDSRSGTWPAGDADGDTPGWLDPTGEIRIGPYRLRVRLAGADLRVERPADPAHWPSPRSSRFARLHPPSAATLEVVDRNAGFATWSIQHVLTLIGRSSRCKIRLSHSGASKYYGALLSTTAGIWVVDLLSSDGLYVNGHRVRLALLKDGDELRVSRYKLRLRSEPVAGLEVGTPGTGMVLSNLPTSPAFARPDPSSERILEQVVQMQQQMSDQFQQAILMITQMFGSMHRDHMETVREELAQIRRLTEQMQALQAVEGRPDTANPAANIPILPTPIEREGLGISEEDRIPCRDPREIQDVVAARLAAFERERQARWKKIVSVLAGH